MPTKHIDETTWRKIEKETVKAVVATQRAIKDSEILATLLDVGLKNITEDDYQKLLKKKIGKKRP